VSCVLCYQLLLLQITNCSATNPYNITGLQSFTPYTVRVAACTIAGEGPLFTVTGSVMTSAGTPVPVGAITATGSTASSVTFSWSTAEFDGVGSGSGSGYMGSNRDWHILQADHSGYIVSNHNC